MDRLDRIKREMLPFAKLIGVEFVAAAPERRSPGYLQKFVLSEIDKNAAPIKAAGLAID